LVGLLLMENTEDVDGCCHGVFFFFLIVGFMHRECLLMSRCAQALCTSYQLDALMLISRALYLYVGHPFSPRERICRSATALRVTFHWPILNLGWSNGREAGSCSSGSNGSQIRETSTACTTAAKAMHACTKLAGHWQLSP
jgi:hypothetical protein